MLMDRYGLPTGTASAEARDAYVAGVDCVLSAEYGAETHLQRAVATDPDFALAWAALARANFLTANAAESRRAVTRARETAAGAGARVLGHVDALCLGMEGKPVEAFATMKTHLAGYPRDAMVIAPATGVFGLIGFSGRPDREPEQLEFLETLRPHLAEDWWFQTVHAFALEELGRLDEAEALVDRALAANPANAHGVHVKAHVLYERGDDATALDRLRTFMATYPREGLMHCHISWHVALSLLAVGQTTEAWSVFDARVRHGGAWGPALNTVTDGVAFMWRAELAGHPRDADRWNAMRDHALGSFPKSGVAFVDVHRAVACVAAGDDDGLAAIVEDLRGRVATGRYPAGDVVPALATGFAAFARGAFADAIATLEKALADTVRIGGSRAQRDLVEATLVAAYIRGGRPADARAMVARRTDRAPSTPVAGYA